MPGLRPRPAGDPPAADRGGLHILPRPGLGPHPGVLLPLVRGPDRDRVPAARAPDHAGHLHRHRPAQAAAVGRRYRDPRRAPGRARPRGTRRRRCAMTHGPLAAGAELNSVDIDVGGTFTDAVLTVDGRRWIGKAPTTPYDLSVCFVNAIEEGATQAGGD